MSIFGIIAIGLLLGLASFAIGVLIIDCLYPYSKNDVPLMVNGTIATLILLTIVFGDIGINTHSERCYVAEYKAQKETIENSINSDTLSDLERNQIVNKIVDINGEFAKRKAQYNTWYYVYYDNHIYDDIEFITLSKGGET